MNKNQAESLLRLALNIPDAKFRAGQWEAIDALVNYRKKLLVVQRTDPEAGFSAGNAMARNKYIYCLADAAAVVHSGNKGGTWSGAHENLKKAWVPLWVKETDNPDAGNAQIVREGGRWIKTALDKLSLSEWFDGPENPLIRRFMTIRPTSLRKSPPTKKSLITNRLGPVKRWGKPTKDLVPLRTVPPHPLSRKSPLKPNFYQFFLIKLKNIAQQEPKTADELARELDINKTQLNAWLKRAISEQKLRSFSKPRRYQWQAHNIEQTGLFDEPRKVGSR